MPENSEIEQLKIGVIGGGAWGTALAQLSAKAGSNVILWAREEKVVKKINEEPSRVTFKRPLGNDWDIEELEDPKDAPQKTIERLGLVMQHHPTEYPFIHFNVI